MLGKKARMVLDSLFFITGLMAMFLSYRTYTQQFLVTNVLGAYLWLFTGIMIISVVIYQWILKKRLNILQDMLHEENIKANKDCE